MLCEHRLRRSSQHSVCHGIPALTAANASSSRSCTLPGSYARTGRREILPLAAAGRRRQTSRSPVFKRPRCSPINTWRRYPSRCWTPKKRGSVTMLHLRHPTAPRSAGDKRPVPLPRSRSVIGSVPGYPAAPLLPLGDRLWSSSPVPITRPLAPPSSRGQHH